jgi:Asp-tRNA(Asn)/Glu-tRNA(Gln) amidotransferase A subunit family amidase
MRFPVASFAVVAGCAERPFRVEETTIAEVQAVFRAKRLRALDARYERSGPVGPLHRVRLLGKDNRETGKLPASNGALVFARYQAARDAFPVARAWQAGALILAKTSMAEWVFSPYETVNSVLPGYTKNPDALDRVTAGSTGGTGAGAANQGLAGQGTDRGNSIGGPSSHQGLVGIRSTMGLTSRPGMFPPVLLAEIAGPTTRTVEDGPRIPEVVAGSDPDDPVTAAADQHLPRVKWNPRALGGTTIGVLQEAYVRESTDPEVVSVFPRALAERRRDQQAFPCMGFSYDLPRFLAARAGRVPVRTIGERLRSNQIHPNVRRPLKAAERGPVDDRRPGEGSAPGFSRRFCRRRRPSNRAPTGIPPGAILPAASATSTRFTATTAGRFCRPRAFRRSTSRSATRGAMRCRQA